MPEVKYIIMLQCHIVKERCSGFLCEDAFRKREGGFADYSADADIRYVNMTCGGCCGRAALRKLSDFMGLLKEHSDITPDEVMLHFSSCICKESFHGPKCPHYDYLKELVERRGLQWREGTRIEPSAEARRDAEGVWRPSEGD